ncbi:MAG: hypothetical protein CSB55_03825 [Candidatus Cloacimonadota bacterium]|nr:MAG: hypothetical protein CSB55_03825 [Candidatus Cloacimonadota bacterium]
MQKILILIISFIAIPLFADNNLKINIFFNPELDKDKVMSGDAGELIKKNVADTIRAEKIIIAAGKIFSTKQDSFYADLLDRLPFDQVIPTDFDVASAFSNSSVINRGNMGSATISTFFFDSLSVAVGAIYSPDYLVKNKFSQEGSKFGDPFADSRAMMQKMQSFDVKILFVGLSKTIALDMLAQLKHKPDYLVSFDYKFNGSQTVGKTSYISLRDNKKYGILIDFFSVNGELKSKYSKIELKR